MITSSGAWCTLITPKATADDVLVYLERVVTVRRPSLSVESGVDVDQGVSSGALLGEYANLKARAKSQQSQTDAHQLTFTVEEKFEVFLRRPTREAALRREISDNFSIESPSANDLTVGPETKRWGEGMGRSRADGGGGGGVGGESVGSSGMCLEDFMRAYRQHGTMRDRLNDDELVKLFTDAVSCLDTRGRLPLEEFSKMADMSEVDLLRQLNRTTRNVGGLVNVEPSREAYFGEALRRTRADLDGYDLVVTQNMSMQLYERRIASLQRFVVGARAAGGRGLAHTLPPPTRAVHPTIATYVRTTVHIRTNALSMYVSGGRASTPYCTAMCVIFHTMGRRVADFWPAATFGLLRYRMDRTHSIMVWSGRGDPRNTPAPLFRIRAQMSPTRSAHVTHTCTRVCARHASLTAAGFYHPLCHVHNKAK